MTQVMCVWCLPNHVLFEREPLEDKSVVSTICPNAYKIIVTEQGIPPAEIPEDLGKCEITRVEEGGDIHVLCDNNFYKVTTNGEVLEEPPPLGLDEPRAVDFVKLASEQSES